MGIGSRKSKRVAPIQQKTRHMAIPIATDRSGFASVPTPISTFRSEEATTSSSNTAHTTLVNNFRTSSSSNAPVPLTPTSPNSTRINNSFQSVIQVPKLHYLEFRIPSRFLRKTTVRVQPKNTTDSEVITVSEENLSDGDILFETPAEKIYVSKVRRWQIFPGKTQFWWDGRLMNAPDRYIFYGSFAVIQIIYGCYAAFVLPYLVKKFPELLLPLITAFSYVCVVSSMLYSAYTDPGIIPRITHPEVKKQIEEDAQKPSGHTHCMKDRVKGKPVLRRFCTTCLFYKPPRATHCRICDNCVERFDHHCPFIGNCVGQRNYPSFMMFLMSVILSSLYVIGFCLFVLITEYSNDITKFYRPEVPIVFSWLVSISSFAVFAAVGFLYGMHANLTSQDITTNEDFKILDKQDNPFNQNSIWRNCFQVLCTPRLPSLIQRREYVTKEYLDSLFYRDNVYNAISKKYGTQNYAEGLDKPFENLKPSTDNNSKKSGNQDPYPKFSYHSNLPLSNNTNQIDYVTKMNNNTVVDYMSKSTVHELSQEAKPIIQEDCSRSNPDHTKRDNLQFKLLGSSEMIKQCLSDVPNSFNDMNPSTDTHKTHLKKYSEPSLPFAINKKTVLVDRLSIKQLMTPTKHNLERFKNMEVSSQLINFKFKLGSQSAVSSFGDDFYKNPGISTLSSPKAEHIELNIKKIMMRESD